MLPILGFCSEVDATLARGGKGEQAGAASFEGGVGMGAKKRQRVECTDDWNQLELLLAGPSRYSTKGSATSWSSAIRWPSAPKRPPPRRASAPMVWKDSCRWRSLGEEDLPSRAAAHRRAQGGVPAFEPRRNRQDLLCRVRQEAFQDDRGAHHRGR